jgi:hypothetical protein
MGIGDERRKRRVDYIKLDLIRFRNEIIALGVTPYSLHPLIQQPVKSLHINSASTLIEKFSAIFSLRRIPAKVFRHAEQCHSVFMYKLNITFILNTDCAIFWLLPLFIE